MKLPDNLDIDFLINEQEDPEWADYLLDHWEEILSDFVGDDYPQACYNISLTERVRGLSVADELVRNNHFKIASIAATAGLEWLEQTRFRERALSEDPSMGFEYGNLCMVRADALNFMNRPAAAIDMFERADAYYASCREYLKTEMGDNSKLINTIENRITMCSVKMADSWYRMSHHLSDVWKRTVLHFVLRNLDEAYSKYEAKGDRRNMELVESVKQRPRMEINEIGKPDPDTIAEIDKYYYTNNYGGWIGRNHLYINIFSQLPRAYPEWTNDNIVFQPHGKCSMLLDDALYAFDHCRENMYEFYNLDENTRYENGRSIDMEILLDTYLRLLSVLNKLGKAVSDMYSLDSDGGFEAVAQKLRYSPNKYLRSLAEISDKMFPVYTGPDLPVDDPRSLVASAAYCRAFLYKAVSGGAVMFTDLDTDSFLNSDVAYITPDYLEHHVMILMKTVREAMFMLQLAQFE